MEKLSKIKIFDKARWIAEHAFLAFLFLFFISFVLGAIMFYVYDISAQQAEPHPEAVPVEFKEDLYQDILKEWQAREQKFESVASEEKHPKLFWID